MKNCIKQEAVFLNLSKFVRTILFFIFYFYGKQSAVMSTARHDSDAGRMAFSSYGGPRTGLT